MGSARGLVGRRHHRVRPWPALAVIAALMAVGCSGQGASKSGGAPEQAPNGTIALTFASADPLPVDTFFATQVSKDSSGHLRLRTIPYDTHSTSIDQKLAAALGAGKLDVGDVGSRAWESLGVEAFRAYQDPFLVTSRELLNRAVTGPVAAGLLATLKPARVTGLAIVPTGVRYLYSTRPLTTPAQFSGAKIRINASATTSEMLTVLGATPVTDVADGPPAIRALRSGALTAIEASPDHASDYVQAAPYVLVNAPLFAKTSTFAVSSAVLAKLPARDVGWLREAAQQAAASQASSAADRLDWAAQCGEGLKPQAVTSQQFAALHNAEAPTYADIAGDPQTALAVDRIGGLATQEPRMNSWATCHGVAVGPSPTSALDGTYGVTWYQADVVASGDCVDCGNAGNYTLAIHDGRYALYHPVQLHANPGEPSVADTAAWKPTDPVEVGTISLAGNRARLVPDTNQQNGSAPVVYTFELFRGLLTWHLVSGGGWDSTRPWKRLN
jgi:TRAP-type C4-dicarboxylate transport system substrate-binding protein